MNFKIVKTYVYNWDKRYKGKRKYSNFIVVFARNLKKEIPWQ